MTKEEARAALLDALTELDEACERMEAAAGSYVEAAAAQQYARTAEKEGEAAIIRANPDGLFTPRAASEAVKEAYLRQHLSDTYAARALAERALTAATYENTLATTERERAVTRVQALTAVLASFG